MTKSATYADAGVDVEKGRRLVDRIKKIAKTTPRHGVVGDIGGFGGLYSLDSASYDRPVLVSSTDGVGTKLKVAVMLDKHDTIGIDLVAMCVNDIAAQGAKPLFFLDYLGMGTLDNDKAEQIISGVAEGCRIADCPLVGGETAEMPGLYQPGDYDLVGFTVGIVENSSIIDGSEVRVGHKLVGVASSGIHSNGFSLVRDVFFNRKKLTPETYMEELEMTLGEALLTPTRIYSETIRHLTKDLPVSGLAHITGGGILENLPRALPRSCKAVINRNSWDVPAIFTLVQEAGNVAPEEMFSTFNMGVGLIAVVPEQSVQDVIDFLAGLDEKAFVIGEVAAQKDEDPSIVWSDP